MFRSLFALFSTVMLGASAASASTPDATKMPLQQRIEVAQKIIDKLMSVDSEQGSNPPQEKVAAWSKKASQPKAAPTPKNSHIGIPYWNDWRNGWKNWGNNWRNGWNNWSNGWQNY